jgi:large subunit ribosomal protein L7/L12
MSQVTNEILEKLKTLTLWEAKELVSQIEEIFGVDTDCLPKGTISERRNITVSVAERSEKTTFDVVLKSVIGEKRVAALKVIRSLTNLGLKEAKEFCTALPKSVKEGITKEEAEDMKKKLEEAGGEVDIE